MSKAVQYQDRKGILLCLMLEIINRDRSTATYVTVISNSSLLFYVLQVFFYSQGIFKNAGVEPGHIPFAIIGTNAVNVLMTVIAVSNFRYRLGEMY